MVVAVKSLSGFVDDGKDGSWICNKDGKHSVSHPDPVQEIAKQVAILEAYLEQRGVSLPKGHLIGRVILPNPDCRTSGSIESQPEVIPFDKWTQLKSESKSGVSSWIKDAFRGGKNDLQEELHQRLNSILNTTPMWDRLEFKNERNILGEFIEFKGNPDDMQALRNVKRSKVGQIVIQKSTMFGSFGRSRLHVLYAPRDYRGEGTSASEWKEAAVKQSTEVVFQPMNSKKPRKFKLPSIVSLTLSA